MNEKNLNKIYEELYLNFGNTDNYIDFEVFVRMYRCYLAMFCDINSSFYHDFEFLIYVMDGFKFFYDKFMGIRKIDDIEIFDDMTRHELDIRDKMAKVDDKNQEDEERYNDSDLILFYSLSVYLTLDSIGLADTFNDKLQTLAFNTYVIEEELGLKGKESEKDAVEYRKCCN